MAGVGPRRLRLKAIFLVGEPGLFQFQPFMVELALALFQTKAPTLARLTVFLRRQGGDLSLQHFVLTNQIPLR